MKGKVKATVTSWGGILLGSFVMSAGFVLFINPYNIVPGGVYGASIVLHNLIPSIQVGTFGYFFDIPLLILSVILLGSKIGIKTIVASLINPIWMNGLSMLCYPNEQALRTLDPTLLLGGRLDLSNHLIVAVIIGSILIGMGCGIVVKSGATTGGTDIVSMIMQKYLHIRFSRGILIADGTVVLFGLIVFSCGIGVKSEADHTVIQQQAQGILLSLYSLMSIYLSSRVLARTINGAKDDKLLFIISDKDLKELHRYILEEMERTATIIKSSGLYTKSNKEMIFIVVSYKEVHALKQHVKIADPNAFVVVTDAYDTFGEGWKDLPEKGDVQPE